MRDGCRRKRITIERHLIVGAQPQDPVNQQALVAVPGLDHRSGDAATANEGAGMEAQAAARLARPVTLVAVLLQDRLDVAGEVDDRGGRCRLRG